MRALGLVLALLLAPALARADLPVVARGSATITGGDLAGAKARALEDAFRQAVDQAIGALVEPAAREASAEVIKKRILRRARAYVGKYKVLSEGESEGVYAITVDATVADAQLGADLRALRVGAPAPETPAGPPPPSPAAQRPPLVLLAVSTDGTHSWASFGRAADAGPLGAALEREIGARGFKLVSAAGLEVPVAPGAEGGGELPLEPAQSSTLARRAGAGGALVAAGRIADGGRIRGTRDIGAEVELRLRVDDASGASVAEGKVSAAGYGGDEAAAGAMAARAAAERAGRAIGARLDSHWPELPMAAKGGVAVSLRGVTRSSDVDAIVHALAAVPGAKQVVPSRYARREVTLTVRGAPPVRALADALVAAPPPDTQLRARTEPGQVLVDLTPAAMPPPPIAPPR